MTDRPIIFNDAMIRAILAGRKTQTRRVIKPQPYIDNMGNFCWNGGNYGQGCDGKPHTQKLASPIPYSHTKRVLCPYGRPGDRLWVRETRAKNYPAVYRADFAEDFYQSYLWTPSIHMPRHASRITLEITGVRVERVQDITELDAMAEGAEPILVAPDGGSQPHIEGFRQLWNSCYPDAADAWKRWNANPFVWVIDFKRVQP